MKFLYTSVPIEPAHALCSVRTLPENTSIWKGADTTITVEEVIELLSLCLRESGFKFRDQFYEMSSRLAMGSPVSPIVANIFMSRLEEDAMSTMSANCKPKLWHRYVDDVLAIVKRATIDSTLQHLNSQHPDIAFTMEVESNGRLPYLDATIDATATVLPLRFTGNRQTLGATGRSIRTTPSVQKAAPSALFCLEHSPSSPIAPSRQQSWTLSRARC